MGKVLLVIISSIIVTNAYSQCVNNNLTYPPNTVQEGIYKTATKIESAGAINNKAKFMAAERITLKTGFSVGQSETFIANNSGCAYLQDYWVESRLDPYQQLKMYTPNTYPAQTAMYGIDTWFFQSRNANDDVVFSMEQGPGTPYIPATLSNPLPATHNSYNQKEIIYSAFQNGQVNGLFYYGTTAGTFRDAAGVYLHFNGSTYTEVVFVSYASTKHEEVVTILETVSNCVLYEYATIIETGPIILDGCGYVITINDEYYKPVNPEVIEATYINDNVLLAYEKIPGTITPCFYPIEYQQLKIVDVMTVNECTNVTYGVPFTAQENTVYCFPDGQYFFIENIHNQFCPYCMVACFWEGELVLDLHIVDIAGNPFEYEHHGTLGAQETLPNNWNITIPAIPGASGCDNITGFEMIVSN